MASYEQLSVNASDKLLNALPQYARNALIIYMQDINNAHYVFPAKTFNLSISDAYYLVNNINELSQLFQDINFFWQMPDQHINNARPEMGKRLFVEKILPFAQRFIHYCESLKELRDFITDEYGISFQIVFYNTGDYI